MKGIKGRLKDYLASLRFPWLLLMTLLLFLVSHSVVMRMCV